MTASLSDLTSGAISSPFTQLRNLLAGVAPGHERPIELTIGEPRGVMPGFVQAKLEEATALYGKYPPIRGADDARLAISEWLARRYAIPGGVDPARDVLMLSGSREGLFFACLPAV
jgi:N-succinyldiaminopimelate aminotransferase